MLATSEVGTSIVVAAITSASIGSVVVALLTGTLERRRHLREQMLEAATAYATQALTVLATLREVKMATIEQRRESTAHRNAHLLTDHAECRRRLDTCDAAQALMRTQHARVRLLFGPDATTTHRNIEFTRAVHRMLNAARRFYERAREPTADVDRLSDGYSQRFIERRQEAWDAFDAFCIAAREEIGFGRRNTRR